MMLNVDVICLIHSRMLFMRSSKHSKKRTNCLWAASSGWSPKVDQKSKGYDWFHLSLKSSILMFWNRTELMMQRTRKNSVEISNKIRFKLNRMKILDEKISLECRAPPKKNLSSYGIVLISHKTRSRFIGNVLSVKQSRMN